MTLLKEMREKMNPPILRFDAAEEITTPGINSSMRDEPDETVLRGPQFYGRSASTDREIFRNRFEIDGPRDPLARG